jgi:hypothetical protein
MTPEQSIYEIKRETFHRLGASRRVWMIEEHGADFVVHTWHGLGWTHGAGVGPTSSYPTLRLAAARLLQLLGTGPVAPQTWPEDVCIGEVTMTPTDCEKP